MDRGQIGIYVRGTFCRIPPWTTPRPNVTQVNFRSKPVSNVCRKALVRPDDFTDSWPRQKLGLFCSNFYTKIRKDVQENSEMYVLRYSWDIIVCTNKKLESWYAKYSGNVALQNKIRREYYVEQIGKRKKTNNFDRNKKCLVHDNINFTNSS